VKSSPIWGLIRGAGNLEIRIKPGTIEYVSECKEAFKNSELGNAYYTTDELMTTRFSEGISNKEIFIALNENDQFLGYIMIVMNGAFGNFPYCRSIAVKKEFRGRGIGTYLLRYFETIGFANSNRLFILVSDFNLDAKKLYERLGYTAVGIVPNLFKDGITENILIKFRSGDDIV